MRHDWPELVSLAQKTCHVKLFSVCECDHCSQGTFRLQSIQLLTATAVVGVVVVIVESTAFDIALTRIQILLSDVNMTRICFTYTYLCLFYVLYYLSRGTAFPTRYMCAKRNLGPPSASEQSSLSNLRVTKDPKGLYADSEESDQAADLSLRLAHSNLVENAVTWLIYFHFFSDIMAPKMMISLFTIVIATSVTHVVHGHICRIRPVDRESVQYLQDFSVMYIFELEIYNATDDPLKTDVSLTYKPWKWYRTISDHGKTLLTLSFNYDVLSLTILTIGIQRVPLKLKDYPNGCFKNLTAEERVELIRERVFDNFKKKKELTPTQVEEGNDRNNQENVFVCNEIIRNENGYAEFAHRCCIRDSNNNIICSEHEDNFWISMLYVCITLVKVMLFMFSPLLIPANMYTASYVASEYVVKLTKDLKMKIFVSESTTTSVRYKHRLTTDDISEWRRFRDSINELPMDKICDVKVPELRIKVKGKRIIPANEPPTGLLRTLYDNLIRCKIRSLDPFKACCNDSIYGSLQPLIRHKCTWEDVILVLVKVLVLLMIPIPYYIRLVIYYRFEEHEFANRQQIVTGLGLKQAFNPYRVNVIQYFSPTHALFLATYTFYFLSGVVVGFSGECLRDKLKSIVRCALHDMEHVSRTSVLQVLLAVLLWPFRKCGLLALVGFPIFCLVAGPVCTALFTLYCIPSVYLAYRLLYHCRKKLGNDTEFLESDKPLGKTKQKVKAIHKKLAKIDKGVHTARDVFTEEEKQSPCMHGYGRLFQLYRLILQIIVGLFCLIVLFTGLLLFVEAIGVFVEILVFTMMGIIVNAGSTLRYVSMALLVIVYMHNCYNNVYENYLTFNGTVMDEIMDRVEDLKKVASLPSSMQENAAFQVLY